MNIGVPTISNTPAGVLARLRAKICANLKLDGMAIARMTANHILTITGGKVVGKAHYMKINWCTGFMKDRLSIKTLYRFLQVINCTKFTLAIDVQSLYSDELITVSHEVILYNKEGEFWIEDSTTVPGELFGTLKRKVCDAMKITPKLLKQYIEDNVNRNLDSPEDKIKASTAVITDKNELSKSSLTVGKFFKFLSIIRSQKVTLTLDIVYGKRDKTLKVSEEVNMFVTDLNAKED